MKPDDTVHAVLFVLIIALGALFVFGCATTHFKETVTDEAGEVVTTEYSGRSIVPPFGKGPDSQHTLEYAFGEDSRITIGQDAIGLDATTQVEAAQVIGNVVLKIAVEAAKAYIAGIPVTPPAP